MQYPQQKMQKDWIQQSTSPEMVKWADSFGKFLSQKGTDRESEIKQLTTSQLRKFFGEMRRIQADFEFAKSDIPMLKPKLAYSVGRSYKAKFRRAETKIQEFFDEISTGLSYIRSDANFEADFNNFVKVVEAIVAYHKYHGGE